MNNFTPGKYHLHRTGDEEIQRFDANATKDKCSNNKCRRKLHAALRCNHCQLIFTTDPSAHQCPVVLQAPQVPPPQVPPPQVPPPQVPPPQVPPPQVPPPQVPPPQVLPPQLINFAPNITELISNTANNLQNLSLAKQNITDLSSKPITQSINSFVMFDINYITPLPSGLEEQTTSDGKGYLLFRDVNAAYISKFVVEARKQFNEHKNISLVGHVVRGFAGIGKSSNLYLMAQYCRADGWFIIYLPRFASLVTLERDAAATEFLFALKDNNSEDHMREIYMSDGTALWDLVTANSEFSNENAKRVIDKLTKQTKIPVLIAVDQWNSIFRTEGIDNTHFLFPFRKFDTLKSRSTIVITAVSATSPWNIDGFVDAQSSVYSVNLPEFKPYNDQEWEKVVQFTRLHANMAHLPSTLLNKVKESSGGLPRLLFLFLQCCRYREPTECFNRFIETSKNEYRGKINSLLNAVTEDNKRKIYNTIGALWLGLPLQQTSVPSDLNAFMVCKEGVYAPICPIARDALFEIVQAGIDSFIVSLAVEPDFKWRAFELFLINRLKTKGPFTFNALPLAKSRRGIREHTLTIEHVTSFVRNQQRVPLIQKGSVVVCYRAFPVVDLVIYNSNRHLYLFQISVQPYASHSTGVNDLVTTLVDGIPVLKWIVDQLDNPTPELVAHVNHWAANQRPRISHEHLHYIYISIQDPRCERGERFDDAVHVVFGEHLQAFGQRANLFLNNG